MSSFDNSNLNINKHFLDHFNFQEKKEYDWKLIKTHQSNDNDIEINVFMGINKKDENISIFVKDIIFSLDSENQKEIIRILKEAFFLIFLKKFKYFVQLDEMILLELSNNKKRLFFIFKGNYYPISNIINISNEYIFDENGAVIYNNSLIKSIIYQITFGLFSLHNNSIIHNNMKTENILINDIGRISISGFKSMSFKQEDSHICSLCYSSPEFLNDTKHIRDEKDDMWALGVIILELLIKKNEYFKINNKIKNDEIPFEEAALNQFKYIITKFGIYKNIENERINAILQEKIKERTYIYEISEKEKEIIDNNEALYLIKNLLRLNPNERFSAREVLKSAYLKEYSEIFENDLKYLNELKKALDYDKDYKKLFNQENDDINFKELYDYLNMKLIILKEYK